MSDEQKNKELLAQKYRAKGFQKLSLAEYEALKTKRARKKGFSIPLHFKFILSTPLLIIFCFGILFIPYIIYVIATGPYMAPVDKEEKESSYQDFLLSENK